MTACNWFESIWSRFILIGLVVGTYALVKVIGAIRAKKANPLIGGVYFISGSQEGTPLGRMLGSIARSYRLERTVLPPNKASGKAFFLERLLSEVVFAESELGGTNLKWERRRGLMALAGYVTVGVLPTASLDHIEEVATR